MSFILRAITLLLLTIFPLLVKGEGRYAVIFNNYRICPGHKGTKITFHELVIHRLTADSYILKGKIIIHEDIEAPIYLGCYLERCGEEKQPDSCKYYIRQEFPDLCEDLKNPKSKGYDFINNTLHIPNPKCPLPKGTYRLETKPLDMDGKGDQVKLLQGNNKLWKMKLYFWKKGPKEEKIINSCLYLESKTELKSNRERNQARNFTIFDKPVTEI